MREHNCCHGESRGKEECAKRAERISAEAMQESGCGCGKHTREANQGAHAHVHGHECGCSHHEHAEEHDHRGNCQRHNG